MKSVYIAVGANMSNPKRTLLNLPRHLEVRGVCVKATSSLWRNPAWPAGQGYPDFINGVFHVEFDGIADDLLHILHSIEAQAGRQRGLRNAPRPLDLDILDFSGLVRTDSHLQLPHPRMTERAFVLLPLAEIAPQWRHPLSGLTALEALARRPVLDMETMQFETRMKHVD